MLKDSIEQVDSSCSATEHHVTESTCREVSVGQASTEEVAGIVGPEQEKSPAISQRLIALLKTYFFVSEHFIACVAPSVGIAPEKLKRMFDELGKLRFERQEAIRNLRDQFHCQYHRCLAYCSSLADADDSALQYKLAKRLVQARSCCVLMKKRLMAMSADVRNQQIAQVLGISEDAVNSLQKIT